MAVALEQTVAATESQEYLQAGTVAGTLTGVTAGSTIVVQVAQFASGASRTWTIADDVNSGDYDERVFETDGAGQGRHVAIHTKYDVAAGDTEITLTPNFDIELEVVMYEVSGVGAAPTLVTSSIAGVSGDVDGTFGYPCSADGTVIDTTTAAFICSLTSYHANPFSVVAGSGFTLDVGGGSNRWAIQAGIFSSAETDQRGFFGEDGANRNFAGGILALEEEAVAGGMAWPSPIKQMAHLLNR